MMMLMVSGGVGMMMLFQLTGVLSEMDCKCVVYWSQSFDPSLEMHIHWIGWQRALQLELFDLLWGWRKWEDL